MFFYSNPPWSFKNIKKIKDENSYSYFLYGEMYQFLILKSLTDHFSSFPDISRLQEHLTNHLSTMDAQDNTIHPTYASKVFGERLQKSRADRERAIILTEIARNKFDAEQQELLQLLITWGIPPEFAERVTTKGSGRCDTKERFKKFMKSSTISQLMALLQLTKEIAKLFREACRELFTPFNGPLFTFIEDATPTFKDASTQPELKCPPKASMATKPRKPTKTVVRRYKKSKPIPPSTGQKDSSPDISRKRTESPPLPPSSVVPKKKKRILDVPPPKTPPTIDDSSSESEDEEGQLPSGTLSKREMYDELAKVAAKQLTPAEQKQSETSDPKLIDGYIVLE